MPERLDGTLAAEIRDRRVRQHLTQEALAMGAGVSRRSVIDLEAGGNLTVATLIRIASVLGIRHLNVGRSVTISCDIAADDGDRLRQALRHLLELERRTRFVRVLLRRSMPAGTPGSAPDGLKPGRDRT